MSPLSPQTEFVKTVYIIVWPMYLARRKRDAFASMSYGVKKWGGDSSEYSLYVSLATVCTLTCLCTRQRSLPRFQKCHRLHQMQRRSIWFKFGQCYQPTLKSEVTISVGTVNEWKEHSRSDDLVLFDP